MNHYYYCRCSQPFSLLRLRPFSTSSLKRPHSRRSRHDEIRLDKKEKKELVRPTHRAGLGAAAAKEAIAAEERRVFTSLYRESLRMLLRFNHPHLQRKLHANLREVYEVLRLPQRHFSLGERTQNARQTIDLLRMWAALPQDQQKSLFELPSLLHGRSSSPPSPFSRSTSSNDELSPSVYR